MTRKLLTLSIGCALWLPAGVMALGLGPIQVQSNLNQPLKAEIPILAATPEELENLSVDLASNAAFRQAGINRLALLSSLDFDIATTDDGRSVIQVRSDGSIREPVLNFLVELNSDRTRLLREFTVFLDPPGFTSVQPSLPTVAPAPSPAPTPSRPDRRPSALPVGNTDNFSTYGPVTPGETLWGIAESLRNEDTSVRQMMDALFRANPQAFVGNSADGLMAGMVLRVPQNLAVADAPAAAEAPPIPQPPPSQPPAEDTVRNLLSEATQSTGQVRLVEPETAPSTSAETTPGTATGQARPSSSSTSLLSPDTPIPGGNNSIAPVDGQHLIPIEGNSLRGLRLSDLNDLRQQIDALEGSNPEALAPVEPATGAPEPQAATTTSADETIRTALDDANRTAGTQASPPRPPVSAQAPPPTPNPETGLLDRVFTLLGNPLVLAIVGGVLLLLLALLLLARRRGAKPEPVEDEGGFVPLEVSDDAVADGGKHPTPSPVQPSLPPEPPPVDNPLERADLLMAVGNYQEAENTIRLALAEEPDSLVLAAKLLDVHFALGNRSQFHQAAEDLHRRVEDENDPVWLHVRDMGQELFPDDPLFGGTASAFDASAATTPPPPPTEAPKREASLHDDDMDLGLDWPELHDETAPQPESAPAAIDLDDEFSRKATGHQEAAWDVANIDDYRIDRPEPADATAEDMDFDLQPMETPKPTQTDTTSDKEEDFFADAFAELDWEPVEAQARADSSASDDRSLAPEPVDATGELKVIASPSESDELAMSDVSPDALALEQPLYEDAPSMEAGDDNLDDYIETKLDLALAYLDMEDPVGARSLLEEVANEGSTGQKQRAEELLQKLA